MDKKIGSLLYIEDDDEVRSNIADYFRVRTDTLYLAKDGLEGLELFKKYNPQVVITDIAMPKMNGIELAKYIRDISLDAQVVITTSFDDKEYLLEAVNLQLTSYIIKPLTIAKLDKVLNLCILQIPTSQDDNVYFSDSIYFDKIRQELIADNKEVTLTVKERLLLELLIKVYPSPTSYEVIYISLYEGFENKDAVKTLIKILRKKIGSSAIETIYGFGYKLKLK
jgi:DNA-binding response OmpR family regulator